MNEFPQSYNPEAAERKWYEVWLKKGYFRPEINPAGEPYSIVIPPPNVTGSLHMGHALNATLQDILIRWKRMLGEKALWVPGADHAGIATQNVVEKKLATEGTDRHALGREAFIGRVWQWKEEYGGRIGHQLRMLGVSADWSRERFTLDEGLSKAVREVFVRLYEDGLIYRATRLINWCPRCMTALSDLEVEHEDINGTLTYIKYPLLSMTGGGREGGIAPHITVATTRPETMLGDTAVAVNPEDGRYAAFIGKTLSLPLTGRKIPVISDGAVDKEFGTGAVKVTPAHDFNDEQIGKRHALPSITVIGPDGKMTRQAGARYEGLDRYECRRLVLETLAEQGLIEKQDVHAHPVGHCYRCKSTIEPLSAPQWYVKTAPLAGPAIEAVRNKNIRIIPSGWENSYFAWMENIHDWCISRQIWWGHRIPVWYCDGCGEIIVSREDPDRCPKCAGADIRQDPDVLDTWFSSALWPFSTLGWPEETADLKAFYPTSVLVTAFDILFFWVARMIMMGLRFMGDVPFRDVYIHALVRDAEGQKMSKSKGNVVDPLDLIERYGADAFRFTLAAFAAQGRDVRFSEERVQGYRLFINKLWNATRFILMNSEGRIPSPGTLAARVDSRMASGELTLASRWIVSRLSATADEVNAALSEYRFNDAAGSIYQFVWHEFCDWYIETSKTEMTDDVKDCLLYVLETVIRLLQPFMPFLAEELWHHLTPPEEGDLAVAPYPVKLRRDMEAEARMTLIIEAITGVRNIRGELNISPGEELDIHIRPFTAEAEGTLIENLHYIRKLARASSVTIGRDIAKPPGSYTSVRAALEVYVAMAGVIDVEAELKRLEKEVKKADESIAFVRKKLHNEDFMRRAPEEVVEKERGKLEDLMAKYDKLRLSIEKLKGLEGGHGR